MSLKKAIYLFSATILGVLLSFLAHAFIEMGYLRWAYKTGYAVTFYGGCALLPALQAALWVLGVVGGFLLGRYWWKIIYVEKRYENSGFICGTPFVKKRWGEPRK